MLLGKRKFSAEINDVVLSPLSQVAIEGQYAVQRLGVRLNHPRVVLIVSTTDDHNLVASKIDELDIDAKQLTATQA